MAATDDGVVELGAEDAQAALALSTEARWNQTRDDWLVFLTQGRVYGIRDGGALVATAALLPFTGGHAWISMVLVTAQSRRRGLATRLLKTCLDAAAAENLVTWLDATEAGVPVYEGLGFAPSLKLHRLRFAGGGTATSSHQAPAAAIDDLIVRDRRAMGFDRSALLRGLAGRDGSEIVAGDGGATAVVRDGRVARHLGPLDADNAASALRLVDGVVRLDHRPHVLDAIADHEDFIDGLVAAGWTI
jgi:GNAT superfamily N-acetyltransferase